MQETNQGKKIEYQKAFINNDLEALIKIAEKKTKEIIDLIERNENA